MAKTAVKERDATTEDQSDDEPKIDAKEAKRQERLPPSARGIETLKRRELQRAKASRAAAEFEINKHPALQIYKEPIAFRCTITPAVAYVFLEKREGKNRPLRPQLVDDYAVAMRAGKWALNGETVKIDHNGHLIDGQHRLSMVIETGENLDTFVIAGLPPDAFDTVDLGAKRTLAQALQIKGYTYTISLASAARILWRYENDTLPWSGIKPDAGTIYDVVKRHPKLLDAVRGALKAQTVIRVNVNSAMYYIFSTIDARGAEDYARRMQHGLFTSSEMRHPWRIVRENLSKELKRGMRSNDRVDNLISEIMNAWNMVRRGETGNRVVITDRFPKLV